MTHKLTQSEIKAAQKNQRDLYLLLSNRVGNAAAWSVNVTLWHHHYNMSTDEETPDYDVAIHSRQGGLDNHDSFAAFHVVPDNYDDMVARLEAFLDKHYPKR